MLQRFVFPFVLPVVLPVVLVGSPLFSSGCAGDDEGTTSEGQATGSSSGGAETAGTGEVTPPATSGASTGPGGDDSSSDGAGSSDGASTGADGSTTAAGPPQVMMETTLGTIVIELFPEEAPITVANFIAYVDAGFYDGSDGLGATVFHRVLPGFVIQGGGLTEALDLKATMPAIVNEHSNGITNLRGRLSMARLPQPDTATSQFFVNVVDNPDLDTGDGYAVFGEVVEGMEIVDAIVAVPTESVPPYDDVPVDAIVITSVTLSE